MPSNTWGSPGRFKQILMFKLQPKRAWFERLRGFAHWQVFKVLQVSLVCSLAEGHCFSPNQYLYCDSLRSSSALLNTSTPVPSCPNVS